ncbi:Heat shock protein GrpE [Lunatimonas lonarensis]|uniref:Protein GrpE n=1 Tax=Lunatimonas lonarensis TaxID=1232681 RepID=R7ZUU8_9BACT|nr:nucleotide exchange factor GrpE [Lunatimonas lonarensis]EON77754.1 Heat shock protein GrpE [Lunatimonas lonarensis]
MKEKDNLEQEEILKDAVHQEDRSTTDMESETNADSSEGSLQTDNGEEKLKAENQDLKEKYLRLYSEFENYRRRTSKERLELIKTASEDVIKELLPILDDFERAIKADEKETSDTPDEGKRLIYNKLVKTLTSKGLRPMEELVGKAFDADMHEAITQIPAPSEDLKGKIVDVVERGYLLGDKVVRYAKVVIGQ